MALSDEILQTIQAEIASQLRPTTFAGAVLDIKPVTVLIDGSYQPVPVMVDDEYVPVSGERVYVIQLGTVYVLVGKIIPFGGLTRPSLNGGFASAYVNGDQSYPAGLWQSPLLVTPNSDPGWTIQASAPGYFLVPPPGVTGIWRMSCSMRWGTSAASLATSWRWVEGVSFTLAGGGFFTRQCAAETHGHLLGQEQDLHAISPEFDITQMNYFGLDFNASTAGNTSYQQTFAAVAGYHTTYASYISVWRVR